MKMMMNMAAFGLMAVMTFAAQCAEKAQDGVQGKRQADVVVKLPGIQKIDMENLLDVPVGSTLLDTGIKRVTQEEDVERELIVRSFVRAKRQMAVCTCLHTKGDTLRADFGPPRR